MEKKTDVENERAIRIAVRMNINHTILASIYENLVDRDFKYAERDLREIIYDLRLILKSIEEDDF
jgi:predicted transcriptional regulator